MKKQTDQQQKTQGKTTKDSHNQEQIQTQDKELLNLKVDKGEKKKISKNNGKTQLKKSLDLKAGYNQHASLRQNPPSLTKENS